MARLDPLIRIRKHTVEEKQKFLARLFELQEKFLERKAESLASIEREAQLVQDMTQDIHIQQSFATFKASMLTKIDTIDKEIDKLSVRIEVAQESMREAFADLKKVEIVDQNRKDAEEKKQRKKESDAMDEIGLQIHRKSTDDSNSQQ